MGITHQDYFSKYSFLYPLPGKTATEAATCIAQWLGIFGIIRTLHCDNVAEFKGVLFILLKKYGIKIINGRARHPQSQGWLKREMKS